MTTGTFVRPVAERAYTALMLDMPLTPAATVDLGAVNEEHYRALQQAVRQDCPVAELDAALGNGPALTTLVKSYAGIDLRFVTPWDLLSLEEDPQ